MFLLCHLSVLFAFRVDKAIKFYRSVLIFIFNNPLQSSNREQKAYSRGWFYVFAQTDEEKCLKMINDIKRNKKEKRPKYYRNFILHIITRRKSKAHAMLYLIHDLYLNFVIIFTKAAEQRLHSN